MLVISRKVGEQICIGAEISVTVVRIAGGVVRLGIDAPSGVAVWREPKRDDCPPPGAAEEAERTDQNALVVRTND